MTLAHKLTAGPTGEPSSLERSSLERIKCG